MHHDHEKDQTFCTECGIIAEAVSWETPTWLKKSWLGIPNILWSKLSLDGSIQSKKQ